MTHTEGCTCLACDLKQALRGVRRVVMVPEEFLEMEPEKPKTTLDLSKESLEVFERVHRRKRR